MTESHRESDKDEQICRRRDSRHYGTLRLRDSVRDSERDSDRLYDRVRSARRSLGMTLWILSVFTVINGIIWYLYNLFPSSVQVSTEIPVLLAHSETMQMQQDDTNGLKGPRQEDKRQINENPSESQESHSESHKTAALREQGPQGPKAVMAVPQTPFPMVSARDRNAQTVTTLLPVENIPASSSSRVVLPVMPAPAATVAETVDVVSPSATSQEQNAESHGISDTKSASAPAVPLTAAMPASPASRLQLGSFQRIGDAERAWSQLTHRHGDLLGGIPHTIVQVDLGVKGTWYRVYAGPYDDVRRALFVCHTLQQRHANCLFSHISQNKFDK